MLAKSLSLVKKKFFSDRFYVSLHLHPNGGITGRLFPFGNLKAIWMEISGLYQKVDSNIVLSIMGEFTNPNLTANTFLCCSGEIIKYEKQHECLILRWVMDQDCRWMEWIDRDIEILFDYILPDHQNAIGKLRTHIGKHSLEMIS